MADYNVAIESENNNRITENYLVKRLQEVEAKCQTLVDENEKLKNEAGRDVNFNIIAHTISMTGTNSERP